MAKPEKSTARPPRQADAPAPKRKRGRPPASAEISRDRILEAALAEFAERGFDGATTAAVARGSGVTQPLVHYYFGTKEGLWRAAMEHLGHRLTNVLSAAEEDAEGLTAVEAIRYYLNHSPLVLSVRLKPGMGLIARNVLHTRNAFVDARGTRRLVYRARYFDPLPQPLQRSRCDAVA